MQARETRDRVLAVARRLFVERGYAATSIALVAREAGVSAPTVFTQFASKVNLLKEAVDTAIAGDTDDQPLRDRPVLQRIHRAGTFDEMIERMADAFAEVAERSYPIYAVVFGAADADPQIAALLAELDRQRLVGAALLAETVVARAGRGDVDEVRDRLWVLMSPLQFGLVVRDRGRPVAWYRTWTAALLRTLV
ncbi:helix-turn-helix domain-containing protein [Actinoplanes sp. NPDC051633]|uniref:TetR/AcrR family transcriptional regulator n=1 Tax=Actinoplanes sp. NPDC051633 TaxID=3155670 RepID=UPI003442A3E5